MQYYVNPPMAQGYTPRQQRAAFNTQTAQAHAEADQRYNTKPLDKAGASRGGAQRSLAGIAGAQNFADRIAAAYSGNLQDRVANADIGLGNQQAAEASGQGMNALAMQARYADIMARLQAQQTVGDFQTGVLGGLMGNNLTGFLGF